MQKLNEEYAKAHNDLNKALGLGLGEIENLLSIKKENDKRFEEIAATFAREYQENQQSYFDQLRDIRTKLKDGIMEVVGRKK